MTFPSSADSTLVVCITTSFTMVSGSTEVPCFARILGNSSSAGSTEGFFSAGSSMGVSLFTVVLSSVGSSLGVSRFAVVPSPAVIVSTAGSTKVFCRPFCDDSLLRQCTFSQIELFSVKHQAVPTGGNGNSTSCFGSLSSFISYLFYNFVN